MSELTSTNASAPLMRGTSSSVIKPEGKSTAVARENPTAKSAEVLSVVSAKETTAQVEESQNRLDEAVSRLNDYVQSTQRDLYFLYDEDVNKTIVTVVDRNTEQVVRQIPNEVALSLAARLNDEEPLRLFSAQA